MKIGSTTDPAAAEAAARGTRTARTPGEAARVAPAGDRVQVSAAGLELGAAPAADFDQAKVDAIRAAIRENRFTVNPGAIADQLIADAAALLAPRAR